jgi:hypothetical protein
MTMSVYSDGGGKVHAGLKPILGHRGRDQAARLARALLREASRSDVIERYGIDQRPAGLRHARGRAACCRPPRWLIEDGKHHGRST